MKEQNSVSVEELLQPRYKVIADYPGNVDKVGAIIYLYHEENSVTIAQKEFYSKYPHLYESLQWWEEREIDDFENIKYLRTHAGNSVRKIKEINIFSQAVEFEGGAVGKLKQWLPSTETEYQQFINSKSSPLNPQSNEGDNN